MNCREHQQAVLDSLAAGENNLPAEVKQHLLSCSACAVFHRQQHQLFRAMQSALGATVNRPAPPSLLPGIRARIEQSPASHSVMLNSWRLVALSAVLILVVSLGLVWRGTPHRDSLVVDAPTTLVPHAPVTAKPVLDTAPSTSPGPRRTVRRPESVREESRQSIEPEVIVLPEEHEAFVRFVSRMPYTPDAALALTRPAEARNESTVEIALLRIDTLKVELLDRNN